MVYPKDGDCPPIIRKFLTYHESIVNHSPKTADEYYLDLRLFFRFINLQRGLVSGDVAFDDISIQNVDKEYLEKINTDEIYNFIQYLGRDRPNQPSSPKTEYGLGAAARARKLASLRSFFKFCVNKVHILEDNPVADIDSPKLKKTLPRYLTKDESIGLLDAVDGRHAIRDYAILTLFLNCGLRRSELAGLNLLDWQGETIRVLGKGNKERILYLNDACTEALKQYLEVRHDVPGEKAMFLSGRDRRMHQNTIHNLVKKHIQNAEMDPSRYSPHKLRHTAATLMLSHGVDVRTLQEVLGHEHLNTTQIYTHIDNAELRMAAKANPLSGVKRENSPPNPDDN